VYVSRGEAPGKGKTCDKRNNNNDNMFYEISSYLYIGGGSQDRNYESAPRNV
jgi:hypothetical protein